MFSTILSYYHSKNTSKFQNAIFRQSWQKLCGQSTLNRQITVHTYTFLHIPLPPCNVTSHNKFLSRPVRSFINLERGKRGWTRDLFLQDKGNSREGFMHTLSTLIFARIVIANRCVFFAMRWLAFSFDQGLRLRFLYEPFRVGFCWSDTTHWPYINLGVFSCLSKTISLTTMFLFVLEWLSRFYGLFYNSVAFPMHTPPIWQAAGRLKTHSMPAWCILFRITAWCIWPKVLSSSNLAPMKFVQLSHLICGIGPRRAINRRKAWINESVSSELETSIWTALLASMIARKSVGCRKMFLPAAKLQSCPGKCRLPKLQSCPGKCRLPTLQSCPGKCRLPKLQNCPGKCRLPKLQSCPGKCRLPKLQSCPGKCRLPKLQSCPSKCRLPKLQSCPGKCRLPKLQSCPGKCRLPKLQSCPGKCRLPKLQSCPGKCRLPKLQSCPGKCRLPKLQSCPGKCRLPKLQSCPGKCRLPKLQSCPGKCRLPKLQSCPGKCRLPKLQSCPGKCRLPKLHELPWQVSFAQTSELPRQVSFAQTSRAALASVVCPNFRAALASVVCPNFTAALASVVCPNFRAAPASVVCPNFRAARASVVCPNYTIVEVSITGDLLLECIYCHSPRLLCNMPSFSAMQIWNKYMKHGREQL